VNALDKEMEDARSRMVGDVERIHASVRADPGTALKGRTLSPRVRDALLAVPRHLFVPPERLEDAYLNRPVPIGYGQTISQPFIVALMTDLLDLKPTDKVLEVGTGSGYQTAVLARLAREVFTIELCAPLAERARTTFAQLGIDTIKTRIGDGHLGWPEAAPFDAIVVTAAPDHIPAPLVAQLKGGGRMVIPVGHERQTLVLVQKASDGATVLREIIPVCFVPLTPKADG
jgi:protein-L-isoaspartate(D-aspartate) O-methyltransferase